MKYLFKRGTAYLIDLLLVSAIIIAISPFLKIPTGNFNYNMDEITEKYLEGEITTIEFIDQSGDELKERDELNLHRNLLLLVSITFVFIIVPLRKGRTFGHKVMNLKLGGEVTLNNLIIRNIFVNGLLFLIISPLLLLIPYYFITVSILSIIQLIVVFISLFMVIYKEDHLGWQDIFSKTQVIENKR